MKQSELLFMVLLVPLDYVLLQLAALVAYALRFTDWAVAWQPVTFALTFHEFLRLSMLCSLVVVVIFALFGLYRAQTDWLFSRELSRLFSAVFVSLSLLALYLFFTLTPFDSRFLVLVTAVLAFVFLAVGRSLWRALRTTLARRGIGVRQLVLVGQGARSSKPLLADSWLYHISATVNSIEELEQTLKQADIDEVLVSGSESEAFVGQVHELSAFYHTRFHLLAGDIALAATNRRYQVIGGVPLVTLEATPLDGWQQALKRLFDIVVGSMLLLITLPLWTVTAFAILIETGAPVIYKNERVGERGKRFYALKFRSMYQKDSTGAQFGKAGEEALQREAKLIATQNKKPGPIYKIENDPRITKVGRVIRRWSIDELPQLLNVLRGHMSLIGPRPHQPREVAGYDTAYHRVFRVQPGITGLAQVSGRAELGFEEEMKLDMLYIERWSFLSDLIILLKTPLAVISQKGAQ